MLFVKIKLEVLNQNRQVNFSVDRCIFLNRPSCLPKMEENYFVNIDTGFINSFIHNLSLLPRTVIPTQDTKTSLGRRPKDGFVSKWIYKFLPSQKFVHLSHLRGTFCVVSHAISQVLLGSENG